MYEKELTQLFIYLGTRSVDFQVSPSHLSTPNSSERLAQKTDQSDLESEIIGEYFDCFPSG